MLAQNLEVQHHVEETQSQATLPELEHPKRAWKENQVKQKEKEGLDVELEDPPKKGMDIVETVRVRRYRANH